MISTLLGPARQTRQGSMQYFLLLIILLLFAGGFFYFGKMAQEILWENKKLKEAILNLTKEEQIGYAKVLKQETKDGKVFTTLKFIETSRDDKTKKILEKEFTIEGKIIHFDSLIVKFSNQMVMDGKERSLYLWRRVYGESMRPSDGFPIEDAGKEPERYKDIFSKLPLKDRSTFWVEIWDLANNPEKLKELGITGIYGNVVYSALKPGLIYSFMISPTGQLYPDTTPEL